MDYNELINLVKTGDLVGALEIIDSEISNPEYLTSDFLNLKFNIMIKLGLYEECVSEVNQFNANLEDDVLRASLLTHQVAVYHHIGDLNKGLDVIDQIKELLENVDERSLAYEQVLANLSNLEGLINLRQGEYDLAHYFVNRGFVIGSRVGTELDVAKHLNTLATVHLNKGEIPESLEYFHRSYEIYKEHGDPQDRARLLNNLGDVHSLIGDFDESRKYYQDGFELAKDSGTEIQILAILFNLLNVNTLAMDWGLASEYYNKIKARNPNLKNKIIKQIFEVSTGLILKQSKRISELAEAERIFKTIVYEQEAISNELTEIAMINLADFYFSELCQNPDESTIRDLEKISKLIELTSKKQENWRLQVVSVDLKSKLALIELNIEEASKFIVQGEIMAREKGLQSLAKRLSLRSDHILEHLDDLNELQNAKIQLEERIKMLNLKHLTESVVTSVTSTDVVVPSEQPVTFIVLHAESGARITSCNFSEGIFNENLLAGLISAIQSLTQSIFDSSGIIERLKYDQYTISFKILGKIIYSYVYTGPSYHVHQKFDNFIEKLEEINWLRNISRNPIVKMNETESIQLNDLILDVFN